MNEGSGVHKALLSGFGQSRSFHTGSRGRLPSSPRSSRVNRRKKLVGDKLFEFETFEKSTIHCEAGTKQAGEMASIPGNTV
jgi:hypothetical protein